MADDSEGDGRPLDQVEQRFAANLRGVREQRGISQELLAARMRQRGYSAFRQQTITRIESGERTVKLGEAAALAAVVGTDLADLMRPTALARSAREILGATALYTHVTGELSASRKREASLRTGLERIISKARGDGYAAQLAEEIALAERAMAAAGSDDTKGARKPRGSRKAVD